MTDRQTARRVIRLDVADPRVLQGVFGLLFLLGLGIGLGLGEPRGTLLSTGSVMVALATLVAFVTPWERLPHVCVALVPLVDIAALGATRLGLPGAGTAALVTIPAIWLAHEFSVQGAVLAGLGSAGLMSVPWLIFDDTASVAAIAALVPLAAWVAGMVTAWMMSSVEVAYAEAQARGIELAEALRTIDHQRRFSEAILDTVDVGLLLLGPDGSYRQVNRRHSEFIELAFPDGHAGRAGQVGAVFAIDGSTLLEREQMPSWRAAKGEEFDDVRILVGARPERRVALSVTSRAVRDEHGRFAGAALSYTDITDIVRGIRHKDEFVAAVSHELRTPLTSIAGYAQVLLDDEHTTESQSRHLAVVARNADRLNRLVSDLLQTAKLDDGAMQVVRSRADLADLARESLAAAESVARAGGVVLVSDLPESLVCQVDAQRIAQVIDNLLSNAVKYTLAGGEVSVSAWQDDDAVVLAVRDTGIGMSSADVERLFSRFFRAREAAQRSIQGVGLGLSITKAIVDAHGGRVEVSSEQGKGSEFRVVLPCL